MILFFFFFQAEDGIRDLVRSRGLGDVYKRQPQEGWVVLVTVNLYKITSGVTAYNEVYVPSVHKLSLIHI